MFYSISHVIQCFACHFFLNVFEFYLQFLCENVSMLFFYAFLSALRQEVMFSIALAISPGRHSGYLNHMTLKQ